MARARVATGSRWVVVVVACSSIAVIAAFGVGTVVKSPWETAVANSQREPLITAAVEQRTLRADVVEVRGVYSAGGDLAIPAPQSSTPAVVTAQKVIAGDVVSSGAVIAEVSGRPVFALATPFSLYRDLTPGATGPDVAAVQEALLALGLYGGPVDGEYGPATSSATLKWYAGAGYSAEIDADLLAAVADFQSALDAAKDAGSKAIRDAQREADRMTIAAAGSGSLGTAAPAADEEAKADALSSLVDAKADASKAVAGAQAALDDARFAALPPLRRGEVARVPASGALVIASAAVGTDIAGSASGKGVDTGTVGELVRLRVGEPSLTVRVGVASKDAFAVGSAVQAHAVTDQRESVTGVVTALSEFRQPDAATVGGLPGYDATITFDEAPPFADGDSLAAASLAEVPPKARGLAIPLVALREDPEGTFVAVVGRGVVRVQVTATGDGYAVVDADWLKAGDLVVVAGELDSSGAAGEKGGS